MKLRPILRADRAVATELLAEGFPALSFATWQSSLARIFDYVETRGGQSVGSIASSPQGDLGICLTIPAERALYVSPAVPVVNLACFYLRPGAEWMTPLFLKRLIADTSVSYVDLTASHSMRQLNRKLGFVDRSKGMTIVPLPIAALRPSGATRLVPLDAIPKGALADGEHALLDAHHALERIALAVEWRGALHPLILTPSRRKGVPGARVILARSRALLRDAMGPLARSLLARGYLFMDFDAESKAGFPEALFWTNSPPVQVVGDYDADAIDHTFSELVFIPPAGLINAR